jgi:hypothetical protein
MKERSINLERAVIANNQAPVIPQPADGAVDDPAATIPLQRATILRCRTNTILLVRADQLDAALPQPCAQRIAIVGFVGNHPHRFLPRSPRTVTPRYADRRESRLAEGIAVVLDTLPAKRSYSVALTFALTSPKQSENFTQSGKSLMAPCIFDAPQHHPLEFWGNLSRR